MDGNTEGWSPVVRDGPWRNIFGSSTRSRRLHRLEARLRKIVREVQRRTVWQCLGIYMVGSWIALQVVDVLTDNMGLPDWVFPFAVVLLVVGLPVVLATAIIQDGLPGQVERRDGRASGSPPRGAPEPGEYSLSRRADASPPAAPAAEPAATAGVSSVDGAHHRVFTWRNALGGGALAAVLLAVVTSGFMFMRSNGIGPAGTLVAKGVIDERSPIIVAEFESGEADAALARAMTEAFRIDFGQTRIVRLVEPSRVAEALGRMQLDPSTPLTPDIARRLARREGIPAIIDGTFARVPGGFQLTARIEDPDGTVLASHRETAADSSEVLPAIDALSSRLRERLGESFTSLRADLPLERVTTGSLAALELYTEAIHAIEFRAEDEAGRRLLEEALAIDPEFASAWRKLGITLRNLQGETSVSRAAITKSYELRDRLTARERYLAEASYYDAVAFDNRRAIETYERMLDLDPNDTWALNNLAIQYQEVGDHARALPLYERQVELDTTAIALGNLVIAYLNADRVDDADSMGVVLRQRFPTDHRAEWLAVLVEVHREDYARAETVARTAVETTEGVAQLRAMAGLMQVVRSTGRLAEADEWRVAAARLAGDLGVPEPEYRYLLTGRFWETLETRGDPAAARRILDERLAATPLAALEPLDRPYLTLAPMYAALGDRERAEEMIAEFRRVEPDAPKARYEDDEAFVGAELALAEGRWDDAVAGAREWRRLAPGCLGCGRLILALAHDGAGRADSALANFEAAADARGPGRLAFRSATIGPTLERMAEILDEQGRLDEAAAYYSRFADLWADADPELQPRVAAARARAEEIIRSRG